MHSVVIPTAGTDQDDLTLLWSLKGLMKQKFKNFEVIVVNDGGHQRTKELVELFHDCLCITYIYQNPSSPEFRVSLARNTGAEYARGDFLLFLDGDCIPDPDWTLAYAERYNPNTIVCGQRRFLPERYINSLHQMRLLDYAWLEANSYIREPEYFHGFSVAIPREQFLNIGGYDLDFIGIGGEDGDILSRLATLGLKHFDMSQGHTQQIGYVTHLNHPQRNWAVSGQAYEKVRHKRGYHTIRNNGILSSKVL